MESVSIYTYEDIVEVEKDANGIGQIRVKGPNVMLGYYEMPEETEEPEQNIEQTEKDRLNINLSF